MSGADDGLVSVKEQPNTSESAGAPKTAWAARGWRYAVSMLLLVGAFFADLNTGYELSSSLFYVIPVAFAGWFIGPRQSTALAVVSAVAWLLSQRLEGVALSHPGILYANAVVECAIYLGTAWAFSRASSDNRLQRQLAARVTEAKEALDREFLAVGELQRGLLPQELPQVDGYVWSVYYATSTRAGGDYYDAMRLPDGRLGVVIADATGHGAPAAVLMAMGRALFGATSRSMDRPDEVLTRVNVQLGRMLPPGWFLTAGYVVIDPRSGRLAYSMAGHEAPLVVRARDGTVEQLPHHGGLPLGPFLDRRYDAGCGDLGPGDTLVLFTDGVTETMSPTRELFGLERLQATLARMACAELEDVKRELLADLGRHAAGAPIEDDTTILMFRRASRSVAGAWTLSPGYLPAGS